MDPLQLQSKSAIVLRNLEALQRTLADDFEHFERVGSALAALAKYREHVEPIERELFEVFAHRGWTGLEDHLAADSIDELLEGYRRHGGEWLDETLCAEARADDMALVRHMADRWATVAYLADRRVIIDDAIHAHAERRYSLSIPALLPFVDGLAATIVGTESMSPTIKVRPAAEQYAESDPVWGELLLIAISDHIFKCYPFGTEGAQSELNRHGILHGRIKNYPSEANSLRTMLLIDKFARIARECIASAQTSE